MYCLFPTKQACSVEMTVFGFFDLNDKHIMHFLALTMVFKHVTIIVFVF